MWTGPWEPRAAPCRFGVCRTGRHSEAHVEAQHWVLLYADGLETSSPFTKLVESTDRAPALVRVAMRPPQRAAGPRV